MATQPKPVSAVSSLPDLEYNDAGRYRIVFPDGFKSEWEGYEYVATCKHNGRSYIAFSHYWEGSGKFNLVGVHRTDQFVGAPTIRSI